ncbi:unnamed protein product, partial [Mycena citricolor]
VQIHDITCIDDPWSCLGAFPPPSAPIFIAVEASVLSASVSIAAPLICRCSSLSSRRCWNFSKQPAATRASLPLRYRFALAVTFSPTSLMSVRAFVDWFWPVTFALRKLIRCLFACRRARTSQPAHTAPRWTQQRGHLTWHPQLDVLWPRTCS